MSWWVRTAICLAAVAGAATGTAIIYRYATRGIGDDGQGDGNATRSNVDGNAASGEIGENGEMINDDEIDMDSMDEELDTTQLDRFVAQEGSMLLSLFGLMFMVIVSIVAFITTLADQDTEESIFQLQMFPPLMYIGMGILAGTLIIY